MLGRSKDGPLSPWEGGQEVFVGGGAGDTTPQLRKEGTAKNNDNENTAFRNQ